MSSERPPRWTIGTWDRWRAAQLFDRGFVVVQFDTLGDAHFDYYALVRSDGYRLLGSLWRDYERRSDREIARLGVDRPDRRSLRIAVPLRQMEFSDPYSFRWKAETSWLSARCKGSVCLDRAPDEGAVVEPQPPVPTPTLTLTPSPTPTDR